MKKLLLPVFLCMGMSAMAQNSLLSSPTTGTIMSLTMSKIHMVSNGTDVVLCIGDNTAIYAVDIVDNDASKAAANTITSIPNFVTDKLNPLVGQSVNVLDMEVNPISKSVYILGQGGPAKYIFKVENNGANVSIVDLSNATYSLLSWKGSLAVNDITYGNNTLYVSSGDFSLNGELGWMAPPFAHNGTFTKRATTLFKSNWGGQYLTTAPLETLTFGTVDGKNRLMGVTTCAPGFSIDAATLSGSGVLTVTEDFNVHQGQTKKVAFMHHDGKDWLFDLHDDKVYRIGKKYLDGSQVTANKYDNNATMLRDNTGKVAASLPADDMKEMSTGTYTTMALWDNYRLLLLEKGTTGALTLSKMSTETPPPTSVTTVTNNTTVSIYPNPASNNVTITLPQNEVNATATIISIDGKVVSSQKISAHKATMNVSTLNAGIYTVNVTLSSGAVISNKLTVK
ncbi:MAG: T9SS type A sorting domain-containing protein [Flavipsychrobacter sp.]